MLEAGRKINDRYIIIGHVGSGGMADVYKAKDTKLNRNVAIKILKAEFSNDIELVTKFRAEAQSVAGLSHPNIVSVFDVGDEADFHYIVMELVEGITLKSYIERKGKLETREATGIAIQIAQGLESAHIREIVHRDIKPQNILISKDSQVKVADFGIAKAINGNTISQNAMGSIHYISPEQARGGFSDERSDIYSLGITLYEMLCGKVPFAGDNIVNVALLHLQTEAIPVRELNRNVPYSLDRVVQKCMQKRPEDRYQSVSELIADLKRTIANPSGDFVRLPNNESRPTQRIVQGQIDAIRSQNERYRDDESILEADKRKKNNDKYLHEESEELDVVTSPVQKVVIVCSIIISLALALGIIFVFARFGGFFDLISGNFAVSSTPTPEPTATSTPIPTPTQGTILSDMPKVVGYYYEQAEDLISLKGKYHVKSEEAYSNEYAVGKVIKQYPEAGSTIYEGMDIILTISVGAEPVEVPNIYSYTTENANAVLQSYDFQIFYEYEASDEYDPGIVLRTIPERGESLYHGGKITLVISTQRVVQYGKVPNLIGMTEEKAISTITEFGFIPGTITKMPSVRYMKGFVCAQEDDVELMKELGTAMNFAISVLWVTEAEMDAWLKGEDDLGLNVTPVPTKEAQLIKVTASPTPTSTSTPVPTPTPTPFGYTEPVLVPTPTPELTSVPETTPSLEVTPTPELTLTPAATLTPGETNEPEGTLQPENQDNAGNTDNTETPEITPNPSDDYDTNDNDRSEDDGFFPYTQDAVKFVAYLEIPDNPVSEENEFADIYFTLKYSIPVEDDADIDEEVFFGEPVTYLYSHFEDTENRTIKFEIYKDEYPLFVDGCIIEIQMYVDGVGYDKYNWKTYLIENDDSEDY